MKQKVRIPHWPGLFFQRFARTFEGVLNFSGKNKSNRVPFDMKKNLNFGFRKSSSLLQESKEDYLLYFEDKFKSHWAETGQNRLEK